MIENPALKVQISICLDCSPSMSGKPELGDPPYTAGVPIDEIYKGIRLFFKTIIIYEVAKYSAEIVIVAFSGVVELVTNGYPSDDSHIAISQNIRSLVLDKKFVIFPIGIDSGAEIDVLKMVSPTRPHWRLKGLKFREFFDLLSQSIFKVSNSTHTERVKLDIKTITRWETL